MAGCVKKKKEKKRKRINHPSKARTEPKVIFFPLKYFIRYPDFIKNCVYVSKLLTFGDHN